MKIDSKVLGQKPGMLVQKNCSGLIYHKKQQMFLFYLISVSLQVIFKWSDLEVFFGI
ncbi:MAG: hypothetical protein K0S32_4182 [Bacteroidetes bacterium]|jgi:hypothetical protein|nr:hypothetical protein [Bacteroidota bacterium]